MDDMHNRHLDEALELQRKAREKLDSIDPQKLTSSEAVRFLTAGANLERATRKNSALPSELPPETQDVLRDLRKIKEFFGE